MAGTLYVVATPLGNLEDLSPRAASTLSRVTVIAAEDTRHTKPLLAHVGSRAELISFHAHSSDAALRRILHLLASGKDVALVTDAGTPTVSDPGAVLVAAARERDIPVVTVPGPTAVAAARLKRADRRVQISLPGGELLIEWREGDDHVLMTGTATFEYEGRFDPALFASVA